MSSRHPVASPLAGVDAKIDVAAALAELESDHRQIIVLRELQQMSYSQISQVLGIPLGTVESRLFRARDELRKLLKDWK
jgi:RNA polymerase sigma-70 factor (ECF subfamily)